jgi:hypothetical protein
MIRATYLTYNEEVAMPLQLTHAIFIRCSQSEVFDFVTDFRNDPHWWKTVLHTEKITPGDIGVGTKFRQTAKVGFGTLTNLLEVKAYDPPNTVEYLNTSNGISYILWYKFTSVEHGTNFSLTTDITLHGKYRLLRIFVVPLLKYQLRKFFDELRIYLEIHCQPI